MKIYVVNAGGKEKFFTSIRKARKSDGDIRTIDLDIDSLPREGCTLDDIREWSDVIDLWV